MKITRKRLEQLIKEELESQKETAQEQPEEDEKTDVKRVLNYISTIDNRQEYQQLVGAIIKHGANIPDAKVVLRQLHQNLLKFIENLK